MGKATEFQAAVLAKARSKRLGMGGYFKILAALRYKGRPSAEIAAKFNLTHNTAAKMLRFMWRLKLIHREGWIRSTPRANSPLVPIWRLGSSGDVPRPTGDLKSDLPPAPPPTLILVATVIEVMQEAPRSIDGLAAELAVHRATADRIVGLMRAAGISRIAEYEKLQQGHPVPYHGYLGSADARLPGGQDLRAARKRWRATLTSKRRHLAMLAATAGQNHTAGV